MVLGKAEDRDTSTVGMIANIKPGHVSWEMEQISSRYRDVLFSWGCHKTHLFIVEEDTVISGRSGDTTVDLPVI